MQGLLLSIGTLAGAVGLKATQQTLSDPNSSTFDTVLSICSTGATVVTIGATALALGAAAIPGGATIALGLGAVATYGTLAGLVVGSAAMGNDLYNIATNAYAAVTANNSTAQAAAVNATGQAAANLVSDGVAAYLNAEGLGGLNSPAGQLGTSVLEGIFLPSSEDAALASAGLLTSTANLLVQTSLMNDTNQSNSAMQSLNGNTVFGQLTGTCTISNSQGPILSGLTGVGVGNTGSGINQFTSIVAPDNSYELVIPLSNSTISYSNMTISAYDPVSGENLDSAIVDLSDLNPNTPVTGPSLSGTCNDTDAGDPDGDDPDCD
jgi:hypothetical protein